MAQGGKGLGQRDEALLGGDGPVNNPGQLPPAPTGSSLPPPT